MTSRCALCKAHVSLDMWPEHVKKEMKKINSMCLKNELESLEALGSGNKRAAARKAKSLVSSQISAMRGKGGGAPLNKVNPKDAKDYNNAVTYLRRFQNKRAAREKAPSNNPSTASHTSYPPQQCPICNNTIHGDITQVNWHIDRCLANGGTTGTTTTTPTTTTTTTGPSTGVTDPFAVYSLGGIERVRPVSFIEGGHANLPGSHHRRGDTDSDGEVVSIDIDGDDVHGGVYGDAQFTESDILRPEPAAGTGDTSDAGGAHLPSSPFVDVTDHGVKGGGGVMGGGGSVAHDFILNALRERIQAQEEMVKTIPKCLVCLEAYKTPTVSISCWHVHCAECWLKTLGSKRLCPQCDTITSTSDLRRIYLS